MGFMDYEYISSARSREMLEIGTVLGGYRRKLYISARMAAEKFVHHIQGYTIHTLEHKITGIENGRIYFGQSTRIGETKRGEENLTRLAHYLWFLGVSEEDLIIMRIKSLDSRFMYPPQSIKNP